MLYHSVEVDQSWQPCLGTSTLCNLQSWTVCMYAYGVSVAHLTEQSTLAPHE